VISTLLHPRLVVLVAVQVEALLHEIDPLGVRLLGVHRELAQAVGKRLFQLLLPQLSQEAGEDLVEIDLRLMGQGICLERQGKCFVSSSFYLVEVDLCGHGPRLSLPWGRQ
jgi:hypothetical protein